MNETARSLDSTNKEVTPRAFTAQVRPPPQPCAPLGPSARGSGAATPAWGRPRASARPRPADPRAAPASPETGGRPAGFQAPGGARAATPPTPQQPAPRGVPAAPEPAGPSSPLRAASRPRDRAGGGDAVTCRGLGRSPPALLSWQPRQRRGGREPKGLVTAPSVHCARAHAGVDVDGPRSPPPVRASPPGASCRHSALKRTIGEVAHGHQLREWTWKENSCFQLASASHILMESWNARN